MTNENENINIKLNKYGMLERNDETETEIRLTNVKVRRIRTECIGAVEAIVSDYDPLNGLDVLTPPSRHTKVSENLEFASRISSDGVTFQEAILIAKEAEEKYEAAKLEYKTEILRRKRIIDDYKNLMENLKYHIRCGKYKCALKHTTDLKGFYRTEVRAAIIAAAKAEAPYVDKAKAAYEKYLSKKEAKTKIEEGVRTLLNLR